MTNDIKTDAGNGKTAMDASAPDDVAADPIAVVLMLQQEAESRQQQDSGIAAAFEQAEIKERLLRRMLEASLDRPTTAKRPHLTIVK